MTMKNWNAFARTADPEALRKLVEDKARECVKLARLQLGPDAPDQAVEELAERLLEILDP